MMASVSVPLILLLVVVLAGSRAALASKTVDQTCAKATSGAPRKEQLVPFCVSSLQAAPGSEGADSRGLAT
jgi:hypothetical protein